MPRDLLEDILAAGTPDESGGLEKENEKLAPLLGDINLIQDEAIRSFVRAVMCMASYFWAVPSSPIPGTHPPDEYVEGGNVLHTKRVIRAVWLMAECQGRSALEFDLLLAGALLHDLTKVAEMPNGDITYDIMHVYTVDRLVEFTMSNDEKYTDTTERSSTQLLLEQDPDALALLMRLIRCHKGQYSPIPETIPVTSLEWTLHIANQVAANLHVIVDGPDQKDWRWNEPTPPPKNGTNKKPSPVIERGSLPSNV